jgi:hypothetical protein
MCEGKVCEKWLRIKTGWEKSYGDEKDNCAQDGTHCPQDRTEGGARYSQDCTQDGTRYSKDGTEGGARCPQDGAKAYIADCIADYTAGSPPPSYIKTDRNRY